MATSKKTEAQLTQEIADAILAYDPKSGRRAVAKELGIPASWVWIVRSVAGLTKVRAEEVERNRAYLKARGIKVRARKT